MQRKQAMQMLLTGDFIDAETARQFGLVNMVAPVEELDSTVFSMAEKIAAKSALAVNLGKKMFYQQTTMDLSAAYQFAGERMTCNMDSEDAREGIDAFIEKTQAELERQVIFGLSGVLICSVRIYVLMMFLFEQIVDTFSGIPPIQQYLFCMLSGLRWW